MAYTTINKSTEHFNTKLYTGNGSNGHAITGVGFEPSLTWLKSTDGAVAHVLVDAIRGNNKVLYTNGDGAESTTIADKDFRSFDSDGFTVDAANDFNSTNRSGDNIVAWNWKANGAGSANTDGSISSTVSANTTAGFSIVKYTGTGSTATIGHGLGVTPKMIIFKNTSSAVDWRVYHVALGNTNRLCLNDTSASNNDDSAFNDTSPTSTVFTVGGSSSTNAGTMIAYCFASKTGYSKFGSYTGNGNADGTFVYTGFKPAFVIWKGVGGESWGLVDNKRDPDNVTQKHLYPNLSNAESSQTAIMDLVSNGFKIKWSDSNINGSGNSYIYMAFAEAPLVGSNNVPCTAR